MPEVFRVWEDCCSTLASSLFAGFKNFTTEQRVDDFNRYFSIYLAADLKYHIPWQLLWIIHADETTVSRDSNMNSGPHVAAMQINPNYNLAEAIAGWECLDKLPNDVEVIIYSQCSLTDSG